MKLQLALLLAFGSCVPGPALAAPVEAALKLAQSLRSPYAAVNLREDPKLNGEIVVTSMNNQNAVFGYLSTGNLLNPGGSSTDIPSGTGFVVPANGATVYTSELVGKNFIPMVGNDLGQLAGYIFDPSAALPSAPVVFTPPNVLSTVSGLPDSTDKVTFAGINNQGVLLLNVFRLVDRGTETSSPRYQVTPYFAKKDASGGYQAVSSGIPDFPNSTQRTYYYPLRSPNRIQPPYEVLTGLEASLLSDSGVIYGSKGMGVGYRFTADRGVEYLYPNRGPVTDDSPAYGGATPVDLGGHDFILSTNGVLSAATGQPVLPLDAFVTLLSPVVGMRADGALLGQLASGPRSYNPAFIRPNGSVDDIRCGLAQGTRMDVSSAITLNDTGWSVLLGRNIDRNEGEQPVIIIPTPFGKPGAPDFCPLISATFLDKCGKGKNDVGEFFIPPNSTCRMIFDLRDSRGKPIPQAEAVLTNGQGTIVARARTNAQGRGVFRHRFDPRSAVYTVIGPFRHKSFRNATTSLGVYGAVSSGSNGGGGV